MRLLISETPVVGSPQRFSDWFNKLDSSRKTTYTCFREYKNGLFSPRHGTLNSLNAKERLKFVGKQIKDAEFIYLHNVADERIISFIFENLKKSQKIFYHYHSPPNEPPLKGFKSVSEYAYNAIFCPAQGYSRFVSGSIPIMNIIPDFTVNINDKTEKIFSCHLRTTNDRWSSKFQHEIADNIAIEMQKEINPLLSYEKMKPGKTHEQYINILSKHKYVIDDIKTGLVHQQFFEALKVGSIPISGADDYTLHDIAKGLCCKINPPFLRVTSSRNNEVSIRPSQGKLVDYRSSSKSSEALGFAREYLAEERIAELSITTCICSENA